MRRRRATLCGHALKPLCVLGLWLTLGCSPSSSSSSGSSGSGTSIRINELMARNDSVAIMDAGDPVSGVPPKAIVQDWVELYNAGDAAVSLSAFGLTDDPDEPEKYVFPVGSRLGPGEFLIVHVVDSDSCEVECETADECLEEALEDCAEEFVECEQECALDRQDCLADATTPAEEAECHRQFATCSVDVELCEALRSDCEVQAMSRETEQDCEAAHAGCLENCNPIGFVADFGIGSNETVYLFDGDRLVDRVGVTNPDRDQVGDDVEDRFVEVSVGRFPDGVGPYGVHYAGATPGGPNLPADVGIPEISRVDLATRTPACGENIEVLPFTVIADTAQLQNLEVVLEYADGCGDVDEEMWTSEGMSLNLDDLEDLDSQDRLDINSRPVTIGRSRLYFSGFVPGDCSVQRSVRVRARQSGALSVTEGAGCTLMEGQQLPTIAINEYMPRNTSTLRFRYNPRELLDGEDPDAEPVYERPDWIELVNYGATESVRLNELGLVGLGRWRNYVRGDREDLNPWRLNDARYMTTDDDGETRFNVEVDPATFTDFELEPGCHLVILSDSDNPSFRITYRPVSVEGASPPVDEGVFPGDAGCQLRDREGAYFFSTDFGLSASEREENDPDGFVLVYRGSENDRWLSLDQVVIDFREIDDPSIIETDPDDGERRIKENVSFGRRGIDEETFDMSLGLGLPYNVATPGFTNTRIEDLPPQFEDVVTIVPRNPRAAQPVTVRGRVNLDVDLEVFARDFAVELHYRTDDSGDFRVLGIGSGLTLTTAGVDQEQARPGSRLWQYTATIPGQPAGTFVTFFLRAEDLTGRAEPSEVFHGDQVVEGVSFRFLVDFQPAVDAPTISEVLPANASTPLPPFESEMEERFPDYAEIHNPSEGTLDLSGYYLAQSELPPAGSTEEVPIPRSREWRFPDGTEVAPGDVLTVYFGPVPDGYLEVDFGIDCAESLYLIAPDEPELGANSVFDRASWNLIQEDLSCEPDRSVSRVCGGTSPFRESEPTPDRPNFDGLLAVEFHSAYHSDLFDAQRNQCVPSGGLGSQINLNAIVFVDAELVASLDPDRNQPSAIIEEQRIVVELEDGTEDAARGSLTFFDCGIGGGQCEPAPEGRSSIRIQRLFDRSGIDAPVIRYRVEVRDVCGNTIEAGPFSVATAEAEKPALSVNELNLSSPLPEDPEAPRAWIELVNHSLDTSWDAGGMFITDNPQFPQKAELPEGLVVEPGGFAVVPLDILGASFDLAESMGTLSLIDSIERGSCEVDAFGFDFRGVEPGRSLGRLPDGTGEIELLDAPSPGERNASGTLFVRGDATEDGAVNLTDMVRLLAILFSGETSRPACEDALDVDDNGAIGVGDSVFLGNALFRRGEPIPPPFPEPGIDPTPDDLPCGPAS